MKGWLAANLFLVGMVAFAALLMFAGIRLIELADLSDSHSRIAVALLAIGTLIATGYVFRALLRRIEKRR